MTLNLSISFMAMPDSLEFQHRSDTPIFGRIMGLAYNMDASQRTTPFRLPKSVTLNGLQEKKLCVFQNVSFIRTTDACSHSRPVQFFNESIHNTLDASDFYATKIHLDGTFSTNMADIVPMGINCPPTARGNYYLRTDSKSPFSIGMNGII